MVPTLLPLLSLAHLSHSPGYNALFTPRWKCRRGTRDRGEEKKAGKLLWAAPGLHRQLVQPWTQQPLLSVYHLYPSSDFSQTPSQVFRAPWLLLLRPLSWPGRSRSRAVVQVLPESLVQPLLSPRPKPSSLQVPPKEDQTTRIKETCLQGLTLLRVGRTNLELQKWRNYEGSYLLLWGKLIPL